MRISRRRFLKGSVLAAPVLAQLDLNRFVRAQELSAPTWIDKPMRWAQLTLVEDDPDNFDLRFWLDYFKRTRSDAVCLSAGGCVAYYPTAIPFHHRSAWLNGRDVLGDLVSG